jgi:hypothetical protein
MKTPSRYAAMGLALALGAVASNTLAQNLLLNGDFTANAPSFVQWPGYTQPWNPGNPAVIDSWGDLFGTPVGINGAGTVTTVFGPVADGGRTYAFLQGGIGCLAQGLPGSYTPGMSYELSFDVAARAGEVGNAFRVQIGDASQIHVTTLTGPSELLADPTAFDHYSYDFTAPAAFDGLPSIQLYNLTTPGAGLTVDFANVSLVQVPEPSASILLGVGAALLALRHQKRDQ